MPYTNIVFIKLFLSLFEEDDRFLYQLNESQQLLYIKLLYLAGSTQNKITKNLRFICHKINYHHEESCLKADIERVSEIFPKFKEGKEFYYFENFDDLHNWFTTDKGKIWKDKQGEPYGSPIGSSNGSGKNKNKIKNKSIEEEPTTEIGGLILKNRFLEVIKKTYGEALKVESEILACITWHKNKGREIRSWDRAIINWMKIAYENKGVVGGSAKSEGVKQWNKL